MTLPLFYYAFYTGFSGMTLYDDWYISLYNVVFTNFPLLFRAMLDFDVSISRDGKHMSKYIPSLYFVGQMSLKFNNNVFIRWLLLGLL